MKDFSWQQRFCDKILARKTVEGNAYPERLEEIIEDLIDNLPYIDLKAASPRKIIFAICDEANLEEVARDCDGSEAKVRKGVDTIMRFAKDYYAKVLEMGIREYKVYMTQLYVWAKELDRVTGALICRKSEVSRFFSHYEKCALFKLSWREELFRHIISERPVPVSQFLVQNLEELGQFVDCVDIDGSGLERVIDDALEKATSATREEIIKLYFGAEREPLDYATIGMKLKITENQVREEAEAALKNLRNWILIGRLRRLFR
ncbi:MAG: hypothetical protein Q4B29_01585 [Candidatus Saccharibacteria bacterium]|nr:hypothetical protein [Candidatus Saccharibacteria bacterium]